MLNLYTHISYKQLYKQLLEILRTNDSIFKQSWVVVPNHSCMQWLKQSIAKDLGVYAQIKFIMPLSFNWEILKNVAQPKHQQNVFSADVLRWKIFHAIKNKEKYLFLRQDSDLINFNTAQKIAQILLKYTDERPELINQWDEGEFFLNKEQEWQGDLWCDLLDELSEKSPVELLKNFDARTDFKQDPSHIILFATEQLSTFQKDAILKLSQAREIHLLLSNPCPDFYWFDLREMKSEKRLALLENDVDDRIDAGNPLLSALGRSKMAIFDAFLDENFIESDDFSIAAKPESLLQSVKNDVLEMVEKPEPFTNDNSILVHACHNTLREVEVIKDDILHALANDKSLNSEDIIVVAPDINDYVDAIRQSFEYRQGDKDNGYLPFHIDRVRLADSNYIVSLMSLLLGFTQGMTANNLYDLISQQVILQQLKLTEDDLPRIKKWILDSNIRNFYNDAQKGELGFEAKEGNTWQFGENRWLSGYLTGEVNDTKYLSTFGDFSGQEQVFSQVFAFLNLWFKTYTEFQKDKTPQQWFEAIQKLCKDFLYNDKQEDFETRIFKQLHAKLVEQTLNCNEEISLVVVNSIVDAVITENNYRSEGQIGIRFQTWENAFVVDAKLLIILGLNDGNFPKSEIKNDLDIFNNKQPRLNKSTRQRDKNLLLTALTENTQQLILSYIGFNSKTNDKQPPSVLLSELINYLQVKTNGGFKVFEHRMHGFNRNYFEEGSQFSLSYNRVNYQLAQHFYQAKNAVKSPDVSLKLQRDNEMHINDLAQFFVDPLDYFLKNRASITNSIYADILKDAETYQPDGLEQWQLKNTVFEHGMGTALKTGIISDNKSGQLRLQSIDASLKPLHDKKDKLTLTNHLIEHTIDGSKIFGSIQVDAMKQLVSIYPQKAKAKKVCEHWIKHLCYQSNNHSYLYFEDKVLVFSPLTDYDKALAPIVGHWLNSFTEPWLFCPPAFLTIKAKEVGVKSKEAYLKAFEDDKFTHPTEGQKYFKSLVSHYDYAIDVETIIDALCDVIEVKKNGL